MVSTDYITPNSASTLAKSKIRIRRRLVSNVGTNDSSTPISVNGKHTKAYGLWKSMLARCYVDTVQEKSPTYIGCSVAKDWHLFSNFEKWFVSNYVEGWHLDKDLLVPGNKVYSAATCVFVSQTINKLLLNHEPERGPWPLGVTFHKPRQKYAANVCRGTGQRYLGLFDTALEAHRVYQIAKADAIESAETNDPRIRKSLDLRAAKIRDDYANGRITARL